MDNKVFTNEEAYKKEQESMRNEAARELTRLNKEIKKERNSKIIKIIFVIAIILIIFNRLIGELNIPLPKLISGQKNRLYRVTLNNKLINIEVYDYKKTTVIPKMIYFQSSSNQKFYNSERKTDTATDIKIGDDIITDIKSYNCHSKTDSKLVLECSEQNKNVSLLIENTDTTYTLNIKNTKKGEKIVYNGKITDNIGKYFTEIGLYQVRIDGTYKNMKSSISFFIRIIEQ